MTSHDLFIALFWAILWCLDVAGMPVDRAWGWSAWITSWLWIAWWSLP